MSYFFVIKIVSRNYINAILEEQMSKIFCLMGKSSSGKDTIFKELCENKALNLKPIISYTTRPKRTNETNGVEYNFITEQQLHEFKDEDKVIEVRRYDTVHGPWYYGTIDDGQIEIDSNNRYIVIVTLEAYQSYKKYFGEEYIYPLYIDLDDGIRLERALARERNQSRPNYDELCRRFLADSKDFSQEKLNECGITSSYINSNLNECINQIIGDIDKAAV